MRGALPTRLIYNLFEWVDQLLYLLTFLKINASVSIRHVSVVAANESSGTKYARRKQRGSEHKMQDAIDTAISKTGLLLWLHLQCRQNVAMFLY